MNVRTSPKKARKPQARSLALRAAILLVADEYDRLSVRQLFYQLVSRGVIEKTEASYKRVCEVSVQMRLAEELPYQKITDGHRSRRVVSAYGGLHEALQDAHRFYRHDFWRDQPMHVEVWSEKDALSGVIAPTCTAYGVPYVATRGFPSVTLLYESAEAIKETGKPATIFYFGDHDASGQSISDGLERDLRHFGANVQVQRIALNPQQVITYRLPTRPGKATDSRHAKFAARFGDASVELDALPPDVLISLVERSIAGVIDRDSWWKAKDVEAMEAATLESLATAGWIPGRRYMAPQENAL